MKKKVAAETRRRERPEAVKWDREIQKEQTRRTKVTAAETKERERTEFLKWNKEIQTEEAGREILRDLNEEKGWRGSKKIGQIRRRFRGKFERVLRKLPTFNVVKTFSNHNAKFTSYFDTYKVYVCYNLFISLLREVGNLYGINSTVHYVFFFSCLVVLSCLFCLEYC